MKDAKLLLIVSLCKSKDRVLDTKITLRTRSARMMYDPVARSLLVSSRSLGSR